MQCYPCLSKKNDNIFAILKLCKEADIQFEAKKEFIFKLLGDEGIRFVIPEYQRAYSWDDNECEALWNDVVSVFGYEEGMKEYFLG